MRDNVFSNDGGDAAFAKARNQRQAEYLKVLEQCRVAVTPDGVDVGFITGFFAERVTEFDEGTVAKYNFPIWKTIGCVLSFNMEFYYAFLNCDGSRPPDFRRDICGVTDVLDASSNQMEIAKGLESYLVAAAALARRIGSSTYDGWRSLLVQVEFEQAHGVVVFEKEGAFDAFFKKLTNLLHLLWADNEIAQHNSVTQHTPTPTQGRPKIRKV